MPKTHTFCYCRSCGEIIRWATTDSGKRMPVDATPSDDGNVLLTEYPGGELFAEVVSPSLFDGFDAEAPEPRRYKAHFATCKQAQQWRKT